MYQLTCPTCSCVTQSSFVRSGAVVRCLSCQQKYRIKSSQVERVLTTGPRTLDEAGSVLRSDSVDIDPEDLAPVKIDEAGNVVGLSGLSELMRQADARTAKAKLKARAEQEEAVGDDDPPPMAIVAGRASAEANGTTLTAHDRARMLSRRRKMRTNIMIIGTLTCLFVVSVVVLLMLVNGDGRSATANSGQQRPDVQGPEAATNTGDDPAAPVPADMFPGRGIDGAEQVGNNDSTRPGGAVSEFGPPEPNPDPKYVPRHAVPQPDALPTDVPTVMIPAKRIDDEGWYVMTPPRGDAEAAGDAEVEFGELTATRASDTLTRLTGTVVNKSPRAVLVGEAHLMLQDPTAKVFAESYVPVALIPPGGEQVVSLTIPTRFWERARGTRCGVTVTSWVEQIEPLDGVLLSATGRGEHTTLRISVRHTGEGYLRDTLIMIEAADEAGRAVARFLVNEPDLYVASGQWLDLVVATPIEDDLGRPARWSVIIQRR